MPKTFIEKLVSAVKNLNRYEAKIFKNKVPTPVEIQDKINIKFIEQLNNLKGYKFNVKDYDVNNNNYDFTFTIHKIYEEDKNEVYTKPYILINILLAGELYLFNKENDMVSLDINIARMDEDLAWEINDEITEIILDTINQVLPTYNLLSLSNYDIEFDFIQ